MAVRKRQLVRTRSAFSRSRSGFPPGFPTRSSRELRQACQNLMDQLEQQGVEFVDLDRVDKVEEKHLRRRRGLRWWRR
jgi:hypothetical protein